jgi:hypothetical protein
MIGKGATLGVLAAIVGSAPALAAVTISTAATQNMSCSDGTCVPTATKAVLNANDLENDLSQFGNVRVMTTGNGVEANDIVVNAAFSSPDSTSLTFDAHRTITVNATVSIGAGTAELELQSGKGGTLGALSFGRKGQITFGSLSDIFGINGGIFTLVGSVQGLAGAVAAKPSGAFALAADYDAGHDGTYTTSPITTTFAGVFEGLGHGISNLTVDDPGDATVGLFRYTGQDAELRDIALVDAHLSSEIGATFGLGALIGEGYGTLTNVQSIRGVLYGAEGQYGGSNVGGLVGIFLGGEIVQSSVSGSVTDAGPEGDVGGLVGVMDGGTIALSHASAKISAPFVAGGLVGSGGGAIMQSYATGNVSNSSSQDIDQMFGGLVGSWVGTIADTYCSGAVSGSGGGYSDYGGLVGVNGDGENVGQTIATSYSTGKVKRTSGALRGGLVGDDTVPGDIGDSYWDLDTSDISKKSRGAGSPKNDPGITGLTTQQLQTGLPPGFDSKIWAEKSGINNGLPYLINNPPPK